MPERIPVVAFVGKSDSGKTTLVEKVVAELVSRGRRVATVKHHVHKTDVDVPGKDSHRYEAAGATVSMVSASDKLSVVSRVEQELTLGELARIAHEAGDVEILIAEGFKRTASVRIEVSRRARSDSLVCAPDEIVALVTDHALIPGVPTFGFEDVTGIADFLEREYLDHDPLQGGPRGDASPGEEAGVTRGA